MLKQKQCCVSEVGLGRLGYIIKNEGGYAIKAAITVNMTVVSKVVGVNGRVYSDIACNK